MALHSFHRGSLALDFVGTVGRRESVPQERLPDATALGRWLREAGLVKRVSGLTQERFDFAIGVREAAACVLAAVADGAELPARAVRVVNEAAAAYRPLRLDAKSGDLVSQHDVTLAVARIAADAIVVAGEQRDRLVRCGLPECRALLLSGTAGERRKWCSMERCGNIAKVRSYRHRRNEAGT